jgi:hypothetical protein
VIDAYAFTGPRREGENSLARHDRMIAALPATGGTIVVVTGQIGRYLMKCLRHSRGFTVRKAWRFVIVCHWHDCARLEGLRGLVIVDWTVVDHAKAHVQDRLKQIVADIAATHA